MRRIRHLRGWIGELLNSRAGCCYLVSHGDVRLDFVCGLTFLEDLGPVNLHEAGIGIFVLLAVVHDGQCDGFMRWER